MAIIVLSGPSGVGKNAIEAELLKAIPALRLASSLTTRKPRPGDVPGKYVYVSRPEFEAKVKAGAVLEWAEYSGNLYGTVQPQFDQPALLEIEVQGAAQIKKQVPDALLIFVVTPGKDVAGQLEVLGERLRGRATEAPATIRRRLAEAESELRQGQRQADVVIVNDDLATAIRETITCVKEYLATL